MLRAVRFSVQLDFEIEEETLSALKEKTQLIENISKERVREELTKTLLGKFTHKMSLLWESDLLKVLSEELWKRCLEEGKELIEIINSLPKEMALRYAAFFSVMEKDERQKLIRQLKFDNKTKSLVEKILDNLKIEIDSDIVCVRRFAAKIGIEATRGVYELKKAMGDGESKKALINLKKIVDENQCISVGQLALGGNQIMEMGFEKGKEIGRVLEEILQIVIENPNLNTAEELSKILKGRKGK